MMCSPHQGDPVDVLHLSRGRAGAVVAESPEPLISNDGDNVADWRTWRRRLFPVSRSVDIAGRVGRKPTGPVELCRQSAAAVAQIPPGRRCRRPWRLPRPVRLCEPCDFRCRQPARFRWASRPRFRGRNNDADVAGPLSPGRRFAPATVRNVPASSFRTRPNPVSPM